MRSDVKPVECQRREPPPPAQTAQCRGVACNWLTGGPCAHSIVWPQQPAGDNRTSVPPSSSPSGNAARWSPSDESIFKFTGEKTKNEFKTKPSDTWNSQTRTPASLASAALLK